MALYFAEGVARKSIDTDDLSREFEAGEMLPAAVEEAFFIQGSADGRDVGYRDLALDVVGDSDDSSFSNCGLFAEKFLDLARIDVEAAAKDQLGLAALQSVIAVRRPDGQVAGAKVAIGSEGVACRFRLTPVAGEDIGAFDEQFPGVTFTDLLRCVGG